MEKLKDANLYRPHMVAVSGKLIGRYNKCLEALGFTPTALTSFHIDGLGWSPEIAKEKNDRFYLNHGGANPHGIIVTPLQKHKPIYGAFHSFDNELMTLIFKTYEKQIRDITRDNAICVTFDQGVDVFYEPLDVLKYHTLQIKFRCINDILKKQEEQQELIEVFNAENNFIDEALHQKLIESSKSYGDLRDRNFNLSTLQFAVSTFYTEAFGGVFVLRDFILPLVIFKSKESHQQAIKNTSHDVLIYHMNQPELVDKLRSHFIIECRPQDLLQSQRYQRIKRMMLYNKLTKPNHPIKTILSDDILFKSYLNQLNLEDRKAVMAVELYLEKTKQNREIDLKDAMDDRYYYAIHQPHSSIATKHKNLINKILINISPLDVLYLYWYEKDEFYTQFSTWDKSFQDWAVATITSNL